METIIDPTTEPLAAWLSKGCAPRPAAQSIPTSSNSAPFFLSLLTLYSDRVAAEAPRFASFLHDLVGGSTEVRTLQMCFSELEPGSTRIGRHDPFDIIVLIACEGEDLPTEIRRWLSLWLKEANVDSAVICLSAGTYRESRTWQELHRACDGAGVSFFATGFQTPATQPGSATYLPTVASISEFPHGVMHWGINE